MIKETFNILLKLKFLFAKNKNNLLIIVIISLFMVLISIFLPALLSNLLSSLIKLEYQKVFLFLFFIGFIKIINLFLSLLNVKLFYLFRKDFIFSLKQKISQSIFNHNTDFIHFNEKGMYFQRINNDPEKVANHLNQLKDNIMILLTNFGVIFYVIYLNVLIGIIYLFFVFLIMFIRNVGIKKKIRLKKEIYKEQEKTNNDISEILNGIADIKQLNMKNVINKKNEKSFQRIETMNLHADFIYSIFDKLSYVLEWIATFLILLAVMFFYKKGAMQVEDILCIFMYKRYVFSCTDSITHFFNQLSEFNLCCNRILEIISYEDVISPEEQDMICRGEITFKNVHFSYHREKVLNGCSFTIHENEKVLLVGESGSGKTTIFNLLTKLYPVSDGQIFIDGIDINELSENYIRKNISIISQYYYLFDMSIRENLLLVKPSLTDEEMIFVCKRVGIHDFIMSLPNQYETIIGVGGYSLSGGQRQRLAIARTLLINSKIILFDEVTSSLDFENEKLIMDLIHDLEKDHTLLVVCHHSHFFSSFKKIMVLHNQKIENKGGHFYLLKRSEIYRKMCHMKDYKGN